MAGWTCPDNELIEWDGTIKAKRFTGDGSAITNFPASANLKVSKFLGSACTGSDGDLNRTNTIDDLELRKDKVVVFKVENGTNITITLIEDTDFTISGNIITFIGNTYDIETITVIWVIVSNTDLPNVLYGTSATPPVASSTPEGTIYIQYTA